MLCPFLVAPLVGTLGVSCHWQVGLNPQQGSSFGGAFSHYEALQNCRTGLNAHFLLILVCLFYSTSTQTGTPHSKTENVYTEKADRLEL